LWYQFLISVNGTTNSIKNDAVFRGASVSQTINWFTIRRVGESHNRKNCGKHLRCAYRRRAPNRNITPALGTVALSRLQPIQISAAYAAALTRLAPRTVHHMHRVLSQALKQAARWRLLPRNPCDDCDPPKVERKEMKVWDVATMATALELARPWRVHIPAVLAALCGLRRGEVAALRWRHVD
jgi:integrase